MSFILAVGVKAGGASSGGQMMASGQMLQCHACCHSPSALGPHIP